MYRASPVVSASLLALTTSLIAACGGSAPPAASAEAEPQATRKSTPAIHIKSEIGTIDEAGTNKTLNSLEPKFVACQKQRLDVVSVLSGSAKLFVRVTEEGRAKLAYLEESNIGDRDTEKCILDAVMGARFPNAEDGEAIVRYPIELMAQDGRGPDEWEAGKVSKAAQEVGNRCGGGAATVTAYVVQDKRAGKAVAVGVAIADKDGEPRIECIVRAMKEIKLPPPGSWVAKVTFTL